MPDKEGELLAKEAYLNIRDRDKSEPDAVWRRNRAVIAVIQIQWSA